MFVAGKCCYFTSGIPFFFPKRGAHVGMRAHTHTYTHRVDVAQTIAIVLAFEWETGTVSQLARSF